MTSTAWVQVFEGCSLRHANDRGCLKCHTAADLDMKTAAGTCR